MTTAFSYSSLSVPLGLAGNSQPQHAAPRPMPASEVGALRAGGIEPTPSDSREAAGGVQISPLHAVSDQPVGRCNRCGDRCVRLTQTGRLIADALCVGTENERTNGAAYRLHIRLMTTPTHPRAGDGLRPVVSDQGSGVWTNVRALEDLTALIAGGVGQHGGAPLMHASSHGLLSAETFCREELAMGNRGPGQYLTETVMEEAEEAEDAVTGLVREIARSTADGRITEDELLSIKIAAGRATREVRDVVQAAETASISQRISDNVLRGGIAESTRLRARDAGMIVPDFTAELPQDAA